jgi:SAM-dependent methyltransferase
MPDRTSASSRRQASAPTDHARATYDAFAPHYDAFTAHHDYEAWTTTLEGLARDCGLRGRRLLDVACGTGKSFLPYLDRGYEVVACDISPAVVDIAAAKVGDRARVEIHDMRALPRLGEFDFVCCIDDAVNYLLAEHELASTFSGMARNLAPGGVALFDVNSVVTYRTFFASMAVIPGEDRVLIWEGHASEAFAAGDLAQATLEAIIRRADGTWSRELAIHHQRHHPHATVQRALRRAGLQPIARRGMRLDGTMTEDFDELENSKAVYVVRARGERG